MVEEREVEVAGDGEDVAHADLHEDLNQLVHQVATQLDLRRCHYISACESCTVETAMLCSGPPTWWLSGLHESSVPIMVSEISCVTLGQAWPRCPSLDLRSENNIDAMGQRVTLTVSFLCHLHVWD